MSKKSNMEREKAQNTQWAKAMGINVNHRGKTFVGCIPGEIKDLKTKQRERQNVKRETDEAINDAFNKDKQYTQNDEYHVNNGEPNADDVVKFSTSLIIDSDFATTRDIVENSMENYRLENRGIYTSDITYANAIEDGCVKDAIKLEGYALYSSVYSLVSQLEKIAEICESKECLITMDADKHNYLEWHIDCEKTMNDRKNDEDAFPALTYTSNANHFEIAIEGADAAHYINDALQKLVANGMGTINCSFSMEESSTETKFVCTQTPLDARSDDEFMRDVLMVAFASNVEVKSIEFNGQSIDNVENGLEIINSVQNELEYSEMR